MEIALADFDNALLTNAEFLMPFALTLTHDKEEAKDLYQETMFRALSNKDKYSFGTNLKAWLYIIMRNIFINSYRKKKQQQLLFDNTAENFLINSTKIVAINDAIASINIKELHKQLLNLPAIFKDPFLLHFQGFKYAEISDKLGEPLGTIKSRIHFARKLLRAQIERF